jgi:hypothetical protein
MKKVISLVVLGMFLLSGCMGMSTNALTSIDQSGFSTFSKDKYYEVRTITVRDRTGTESHLALVFDENGNKVAEYGASGRGIIPGATDGAVAGVAQGLGLGLGLGLQKPANYSGGNSASESNPVQGQAQGQLQGQAQGQLQSTKTNVSVKNTNTNTFKPTNLNSNVNSVKNTNANTFVPTNVNTNANVNTFKPTNTNTNTFKPANNSSGGGGWNPPGQCDR